MIKRATSCLFLLVVMKLQAQITFNCPADRFEECGMSWSFDIPSAVTLCANDAVTVTVIGTVTNLASPRCPGIFSVTRTWRATDSCDNAAFCNQTVTIVDTEPPNITCEQDKEVQCGTDWAFDIPTAVDKCDLNNVLIQVVSTVTNTASPRCPRIFSVTRTWRASDTCGNAAFCNQTVTIVDTEPPNITCHENKEVQCGTDWAFDIPTAVDKCDLNNVLIEVVSTVTNVALPRCPRLFSVTRTWRVTDTCGNAAFCNQTVTIVDTEPPNITCHENKEVQCGTDWAFDIPTAVGKCDLNNVLIEVVATVTNVATPRCPRIFSVTRTWRATDTCGNSAFCNQTVSIVDTEPPNLTCGPDKEVQCGTDWAFDIPTAVDKCDLNNVLIEVVATVTNVAAPRCPRIFSVTRTWRATDTCGNSAFCNQTVTIVDTEPPNLTCGPDKEVQCGTDWAFDIPTAVDKCDLNNVLIEVVATVTNVATPRCLRIFSVTRTWRATDTCGNSAFCNQTVTIVDTEPPNLTCGPNKEVQCGTDWAFDIPTAVDKCDLNNVLIEVVATVTNVATPRCPRIFSVTRTWRASDTCGNSAFCNQTVSIVDTEPPNLTCGPNKEVQCGTDWAFDIPTAVDKCDLNNVLIEVVATVTNVATPRCPRIFSVTRTWRATDTCGNSAFCNQTVTIVDTEPPNLTCADDRIVESGVPFAFTRPFAVDVCDGTNVTITIVSTVTNVTTPRCPGLFSVRRTWSATDTCGNQSLCSQTILVVDTRPPVLSCADDRFVECGFPSNFTPPYAYDVCDGTNVTVSVFSTETNLVCGRSYIATRTWLSSDQCGNVSACSQSVYVVDTTPPSLNCTPDRVVDCGIPWTFTKPSAIDICDGSNVTVSVVSTVTNVLCGNSFAATRTWSATDQCGNEASCSQTVVVQDRTPPNIVCHPPRMVECAQAWTFDEPIASDTCAGSVSVTIVSTVTNSGPANTFMATRTWKATDDCANMAYCSQTVTILPCPQGGGCRVTGGSKHQTNTYQAPCLTTPWPTYTSHGGQVGAPFSVGTPFTPNSPCITGEWQHNRHLPGNRLAGTFLVSSKGYMGHFDSLLCACLPCEKDPNGVGVVGTLCNPDDWFCGPKPYHPPASKICFSGVGDYTFFAGKKKTVKAVFRVDIEDRGNSDGKDGSVRPDRYRIRLWLLDSSCGRDPDPESAEALALRIAVSADPARIANLATTEELAINIPPDIDDGGDLTQGDQQIRPLTTASCSTFVAAPAAAIEVATEVAGLKSDSDCVFATLASAYQGTQDPAFVHRVTITNCGSDTLTNIVVTETTDTILEDTTSAYFETGATLPPGGFVTLYYTNTLSADSVRSIVVVADSSGTGENVVANSSSMASVSATEAPGLKIQQAGLDLILSWPSETAPEFLLETTSSLAAPEVWSVIPNATSPLVIPGGMADGARFYRLRSP